MASVSPGCSPGKLASRLEALEVRVESAIVERHAVTLPDYPGGPRPSSVLRLSGLGLAGVGENVAFFEAEHERFSAYVARWFAAHRAPVTTRVGSALGAEGSHYERAALESALIDLGLRQAGLSLYDLTGVREASLRFVVSLAADPDPRVVVHRLRSEGYLGDLKLDVDPSWTPTVLEALAQDSSIAIFDFKGRADASFARRLYEASPSALFEDPPSDFAEPEHSSHPSRISRDATIPHALAVADARARDEAVNLKAPRMGGPLAVLRGLEYALAANPGRAIVPAYLGGMFEVNVGRVQARQIAALYCASAPNDLALNVTDVGSSAGVPAQSPARIELDQPGFGASSLGHHALR
jgi:L-alanine-DL-glutamate epimerase-like enolase superfamily enzyme